MATYNVTYQFEDYFATYDRRTEQDRIDEIENKKLYSDDPKEKYVAKFDVNMDERELIDEGKTQLAIVDDELVLQGWLLP